MLTSKDIYLTIENLLYKKEYDTARTYMEFFKVRSDIENNSDSYWDEILRRNEYKYGPVHYYEISTGPSWGHSETKSTICLVPLNSLYSNEWVYRGHHEEVTCENCLKQMVEIFHGPYHYQRTNGVTQCQKYSYLRNSTCLKEDTTCLDCLRDLGLTDKEPEDYIPLEFQGTPEEQLERYIPFSRAAIDISFPEVK